MTEKMISARYAGIAVLIHQIYVLFEPIQWLFDGDTEDDFRANPVGFTITKEEFEPSGRAKVEVLPESWPQDSRIGMVFLPHSSMPYRISIWHPIFLKLTEHNTFSTKASSGRSCLDHKGQLCVSELEKIKELIQKNVPKLK